MKEEADDAGKAIMTYPPVTVTPATPIRDAERLMLERRNSGLPVVDHAGNPVGIVTEADLLLKETAPEAQRAGDRLDRPLVVAPALAQCAPKGPRPHGRRGDDPECHHHRRRHRGACPASMRFQINQIPVVCDQQLVGIVSWADISRLFLRND